ncbi:MAG: PQQ-dependent sugar dehydrogenase [Nocardioidaceae bacterium]
MDRRTLLKSGLAATAGGLLVPATGAMTGALTAEAAAAPRVGRVLARNLVVPWGIAFLPSGDALVSARNSGRVLRVRKSGGYRVVGRVPGVVNIRDSYGGEGGLLSLELHPDFRNNRWVYAYMSTASDNRVVRMRYADGRLGPPRVVLAGIPVNAHHNGGGLAFGPGGLLYVSTGDAEDGSRAQNRRSLGGKVLRMTPEGEVPRGNPFGNYTWSYGHRNPEQITFDGAGNLWSSEFGEKDKDELNRIVKGGNYGWPRVEGKDGPGGYRDPLAQWDTDICSPSGIAVAAGRAWLGALRGQCLWSVRLGGPNRGRKARFFTGQFGRIRSVAKAPDGSLWITTSNRDGRTTPGPNDDRIIRIRLG